MSDVPQCRSPRRPKALSPPPPGRGTPKAAKAPAAARGAAAAAPDHPACRITPAGATWLASADPVPHRTGALWATRPHLPVVLPCGTVFDVVSAPALFGRALLERLWSAGPGSGPVATHRDRVLLFAAPGTARRLPALLEWEEWNRRAGHRGESIPPLFCHGLGDAVTVPPPRPAGAAPAAPRWVVAPATSSPWLPGPGALLWAARSGRGRRTGAGTGPVGISIFTPRYSDANVYDVGRRR